MKYFLDARGLACPLPVINTKSKLDKLNAGDVVEVAVDNEIAVQNLGKFSNVRGFPMEAVKINDDEFRVSILKGEKNTDKKDEDVVCNPDSRGDFIVVISSDKMGLGDETLGHNLLKAFVFSLTKQDKLPDTILCYNSGAFITTKGSEMLEDLKLLESEGVNIYTCGTCLDFYDIKDKLAVGSVTNMYDITETMERALKIIKP